MTASDVPTTTGMRFPGYPVFEAMVLWDLSDPSKPAGLRPGLAERWEQDPNDPRTWVFQSAPWREAPCLPAASPDWTKPIQAGC